MIKRTIGPATEHDEAQPVLLKLGPVTVRSGAKLDLTIAPPPATATAGAPSPAVATTPQANLVLREFQWLAGAVTFGLSVGNVAAGRWGAIVGGVVSYLWADRRLRKPRDSGD